MSTRLYVRALIADEGAKREVLPRMAAFITRFQVSYAALHFATVRFVVGYFLPHPRG